MIFNHIYIEIAKIINNIGSNIKAVFLVRK